MVLSCFNQQTIIIVMDCFIFVSLDLLDMCVVIYRPWLIVRGFSTAELARRK